jgi:hypothetical protein
MERRTQFKNLHASRHKTYVLESTDSGVIYAKKTTKYYEILQNNPKKPKIYSRKVPVSHHFLSKVHQKARTFALIYPPNVDFYSQIQKNTRISQVSETNTLNSIYIKDIQNILSRNMLHPSPDTNHEKMKNEPNPYANSHK